MTTASQLRTLVTIQAKAVGEDALGQPTGAWQTLATTRAEVRHGSGAQAIQADANVSTVRMSARIRRRSDITAEMRLLLGAAVYDIKAVVPVEDGRQFIELVCEAVK